MKGKFRLTHFPKYVKLIVEMLRGGNAEMNYPNDLDLVKLLNDVEKVPSECPCDKCKYSNQYADGCSKGHTCMGIPCWGCPNIECEERREYV